MLLNEKTILRKQPVQEQATNTNLSVACYNPANSNTGRTTTTYKFSDDTNDLAQTGSFYLLPDSYNRIGDSEENDLFDLISEEDEMLLFDHPINTNHHLHKI